MTSVCSTAALVIGLMGAPAPPAAVEESVRIGRLRAAAIAVPVEQRVWDSDRRRLMARSFESSAQASRRDPIGDGVKKGAWIGGAIGLGTIALLSTQCAGGCDDPSIGVALPAATALGAGVGALIGLIADAVR